MSQPAPKPASKAGPIGAGLVLASAGLMAFLGRWEGANENTVYADKLASGLPTVCKGLTHHVTTTPIIVGDYWPDEKCEAEERKAVIAVQTRLLACFTITPPQAVFDMATSHAWNLGASKTCGSQAMASWRAGNWQQGCRRLQFADSGKLVWAYAGGKFVRGLANRRGAENEYCQEALK